MADERGGPARRRRQNVAIVSGFVAQSVAAGRNPLLVSAAHEARKNRTGNSALPGKSNVLTSAASIGELAC
jgi:hypothetical protein